MTEASENEIYLILVEIIPNFYCFSNVKLLVHPKLSVGFNVHPPIRLNVTMKK